MERLAYAMLLSHTIQRNYVCTLRKLFPVFYKNNFARPQIIYLRLTNGGLPAVEKE